MGFPGEVTAYVFFNVTERNSIVIDYMAMTTAPTVINMTNHSYFNLSGDPTQAITDHLLYLILAEVIDTPQEGSFGIFYREHL